MKKTIFVTLVGVFATTLAAVILYVALSISYNNSHVGLHNRFDAEQGRIENRLDNMWKIISEKLQIKNEYAEDFKATARVNVGAFQSGGEAWKWISTQIPQLDPGIYREVMATIESERLSFEKSQNQIVDVVLQHNNLIQRFPGRFFISDKTPLEWKVISSTGTKEIMGTREDNRTIAK